MLLLTLMMAFLNWSFPKSWRRPICTKPGPESGTTTWKTVIINVISYICAFLLQHQNSAIKKVYSFKWCKSKKQQGDGGKMAHGMYGNYRKRRSSSNGNDRWKAEKKWLKKHGEKAQEKAGQRTIRLCNVSLCLLLISQFRFAQLQTLHKNKPFLM